MKNIRIFSAGVAGKLTKKVAEKFESEQPEIKCEVVVGGSTGGIRRLTEGENFDVMILADSSNIDEMMMPEYTNGYFIWGGNEMVVMGKKITNRNWKQKLLDPDAEIHHANPYDDPGGYRAVMAMELASEISEGLSEKLICHPNYKGLDHEQYKDGFRPVKIQEEGIYNIVYKSIPVSLGAEYTLLPAIMNLGDPAYEKIYQKAEFEIDGGKKVKGTTILHGVTIPKTAANKKEAQKFVKMFLKSDFSKFGFTGVQKKVGEFII